MGRERSSTLRVAVTGPTSEFGALLLPRLLAEPRIAQLLTFGPRPVTGARLVHHRVDLTRWDVESELEAALSEAPVDLLFHLAFLHGRTRSAAFAHELEVIGTLDQRADISGRVAQRLTDRTQSLLNIVARLNCTGECTIQTRDLLLKLLERSPVLSIHLLCAESIHAKFHRAS